MTIITAKALEVKELLRVVVVRNRRFKAAEFRLRPGERGLSLFARVHDPGPEEIIAAVEAMGKQGDLAIAVLPAEGIVSLGLRLVRTPGGTGRAELDDIHYEARLPAWRQLILGIQGQSAADYFNERYSRSLFELAQVLDREA